MAVSLALEVSLAVSSFPHRGQLLPGSFSGNISDCPSGRGTPQDEELRNPQEPNFRLSLRKLSGNSRWGNGPGKVQTVPGGRAPEEGGLAADRQLGVECGIIAWWTEGTGWNLAGGLGGDGIRLWSLAKRGVQTRSQTVNDRGLLFLVSGARTEIYIRGTDWIGDAVMSVPALREVRHLCPNQSIVLVVRGWVAGLFQGQDLADRLLVLSEDEGSLAALSRLRSEMRGTRRTILFKNAFSAALACWLAGVPERMGYATDGRSPLLTHKAVPRIRELGLHQIFYYLDLLYQTGISNTDYLSEGFQPDISLKVAPQGRREAQRLLDQLALGPNRPLILLNPGAFYGSAKRWFSDRYANVADLLIKNLGAEIVIIGSDSERRIAEEIAGMMISRPHVLSGRTSLPGLMGLLVESDLLITNDSGPMHLAAALNTPQIALFGSTDEIATGPFSPHARVLHRHVECSPCLLRECPIDLRCFRSITVREVVTAAEEILTSGQDQRSNRSNPHE